jgi:hypothetical protein
MIAASLTSLGTGSRTAIRLGVYPESVLVEVVATRVANALIDDARVNGGEGVAIGLVRRSYGGLWVGGRATLTTEAIRFRPNGVNRAVQTGTLEFEIPLTQITSVEVLPGVLTRIIEIRTAGSVAKIRCFRADVFAAQIADQVEAAQ